jgi:regulator of RNase E activity RraA
MSDLDESIFKALGDVDTPTICNALEVVRGGRSTTGFTTVPTVALDPHLPPIVGFAVTAKIVASEPAQDAQAAAVRRLDYYRMVGEAAAARPTVVVIEDGDRTPGTGAWWGEVHVAVHLGLGVRGVLTNGSMRDLGDVDEGFQILAGSIGPSHAFVHLTAIDVPVTVLGLQIRPGDLIHADRHGAALIRSEEVSALPAAIRQVEDAERPIISAARSEGFDLAKLLELYVTH